MKTSTRGIAHVVFELIDYLEWHRVDCAIVHERLQHVLWVITEDPYSNQFGDFGKGDDLPLNLYELWR